MEETAQGLENELLLVVDSPELRAQVPVFGPRLIEFLGKEVVSLPCLESAPNAPGRFLRNGNRIYWDVYYVENATAECLCPEDVLTHQRAGELLILSVLPKAAEATGMSPDAIHFVRAVTDYAGNYCGAHSNIMVRRHTTSELVPYLTPFLVTRYYACAGGWGPPGFVMTHKAQAIRCLASQDTRKERPIVNLKQENLSSASYKRVHLANADATMSELGTYLTIGTTALVLRMLDDGACVGPAMALHDPVDAVHALDTDPTWRRPLPLACGREASALEINDHYLRAAEAYTSKKAGPPWTERVVRLWRKTNNKMRHGPAALVTDLDPFIKAKLYGAILSRHGMDLREFGKWCGALSLVERLVTSGDLPKRGLRDFLRERLPFVTFLLLEERMERQDLSWSHLGRALGLWQSMLLTDLLYHDIGEQGLYWRLQRTGAVNSRIVDEASIARAMNEPPKGTRAEQRAETSDEFWGTAEDAAANWDRIVSSKFVWDLSDPLVTSVEKVPRPTPKPKRTKP